MVPLAARLGVATAAVGIAVAVRWALSPLTGESDPLLLFSVPVMIAARFGGFRAGLFATALSAACGVAVSLNASGVAALRSTEQAGYLALFVLVGAGISWLADPLRRAQDAAVQAAEQKRLLAEALPQMVWTCEPDGRCDYFNARWVEYTGVPAAKQLGYGWLDQTHPDDRESVLAAWRAAVSSGEEFGVEFRIRRFDGAYRWFDTRALAQRDAAGRIVKWFGTNTDIGRRDWRVRRCAQSRSGCGRSPKPRLPSSVRSGCARMVRPASRMQARKSGTFTTWIPPTCSTTPRPSSTAFCPRTVLAYGSRLRSPPGT
jgi:PAS domain S-box-containing protein